ncbi:MAG: alpha-L-fucosidase [Opitutaceae bacterium]|jgi:alpha-L-fucosidase|nr:alpha-L-fucosidase [Opitutaceae bacterium]
MPPLERNARGLGEAGAPGPASEPTLASLPADAGLPDPATLGENRAVRSTAAESAELREARIAWWREARFGLFIHFGLYAIPGRGEWVQWNEQIPVEDYARLADQFTLRDFDAGAWADVARAAGMRYTVLTARHHDGFALFADEGNAFTSVAAAARRDVVRDYVDAVRAAGLRVGLYYSPMDWRFPGYILPDLQRASAVAMREQYHRQMDTLLAHYGKLDVVWFDGGENDWLSFGGDWKGAKWEKRPAGQARRGGFDWEHDAVYRRLRELQPDALINGRADMPADFHSREGDKALGDFDNQRPWELCTTLAGAWGYQPDKEPKSLEACVRLLVKVAGRDGNLLLNVGPAPDGRIAPAQVARLREIGDWLGRHGESIYGTRGGPFLPGDYGVSTHRDRTVYLHILDWPGDGAALRLPAPPCRILRVTRLGGGAVEFRQGEDALELVVPTADRDELDTILVLELDRAAAELPLLAVPVALRPQG